MIQEEVEYRLADYYFMRDMEEDFENRLSGVLLDSILKVTKRSVMISLIISASS